MSHNRARRRLARIRCVLETVNALRDGKALPEALCFVPQEIEYRSSPDLQQEAKASRPLIVRCKPSSSANALGKIPHSSELRIFVSGEEFSNGDGDWIKLSEVGLGQLGIRLGLDLGFCFSLPAIRVIDVTGKHCYW